MQVNNEAIYNAGYAGLDKQDWGYITKSRKTGNYYLIVFNVPVNKALRLKLLPGMGIKNSMTCKITVSLLTLKK